MTSPARPNILFICTDQQHWQKNGFNGHPLVHTPNLDRLASVGANFRTCYSNSPVCAPARAALFTGRFASDVGAYDNAAPFDGRAPTFGTLAREQGYHCFATGKLDFLENTDYGFIEDGTSHGHDRNPDITALFRNPLCQRPGYANAANGRLREGPPGDARTVARGCRFLAEESANLDRPWLCWVGLNLPHPPFRTTQEMFDLYADEDIDLPEIPEGWQADEHPVIRMTRYHRNQLKPASEENVRRARPAYYGMITEADPMIGDLLNALETTGQAGNTVIIFTSDHGEMLGEHGFWLKNAPWEPCARVPLLIAGPGFPAGKVIDTPVSLVDIHATIADIVGGRRLDGIRGHSLLPLIEGDASHHAHVVMELNTERLITGVFALRRGDWKYNYYVDYPDQLFNLREDPGEWHDLAPDRQYADVRSGMRRTLLGAIDADRVNDEAFADQARRLDKMVGDRDEEYLVELIRSRLGEPQARKVARRYFMRRA